MATIFDLLDPFLKNVSRDLKKALKITLEGILYSGGVKVRKFQLVSQKKLNWCLMLKYIESYILQRWWVIKVGVYMTLEKVWSNMRTTKCESHEDHGVCNQIEDKDDYVHLVFEVMTHKNCWQ